MSKKQFNNIQWYPGHMARSIGAIKNEIDRVDVVIEVADARIPNSSRNPSIKEFTEKKKHLLIFSHADLADPEISQQWVQQIQNCENIDVFALCLRSDQDIKYLRRQLDKYHKPILAKAQKKGLLSRPLRLLIAGVPNTGKSTLINNLLGKSSAAVEARPGVTRSLNWLRLSNKLELLDTPGLLPAKIKSDNAAFALAVSGAIKDSILPLEDIAFRLFQELYKHYPKLLNERYRLNLKRNSELRGDLDIMEYYNLYLEAASNMGCLQSGGNIDKERFARMLINDFRSGRLGRISLERPKINDKN